MTDRVAKIVRAYNGWRIVCFLALDAAALTAYVALTKSEYESFQWTEVFLGTLLIQGILLILGLRQLLWMLVSAWLVEPKFLERQFLEVLRQAKLPALSRRWYSVNFKGLEHMAQDDDLIAEHRVSAATIYAAYSAALASRGIMGSIIIEQAFDRAILQYDQEVKHLGPGDSETD